MSGHIRITNWQKFAEHIFISPMKQEHVNLGVNGPKRTIYKCCLVPDQQHPWETNRMNKCSPTRFASIRNYRKIRGYQIKIYCRYWRKYLDITNFCSKWYYTKPDSHITLHCKWGENKMLWTSEFGNWNTQFKEIYYFDIRDRWYHQPTPWTGFPQQVWSYSRQQ